ncbi:MAG: PP2C family protein-serine/threonine phosphatase [Polyangiaceae bacterium]
MISLLILGASVVLAVTMLLILRELRLANRSASRSRPPVRAYDPDERDDITKVAASIRQPRSDRPGPRPTDLPKLQTDDVEADSYSSKSAATVYESDSEIGLDDPTGPIDMILVHAVGQSDVGHKRHRNEDSYLILPKHGLFVVADGMGGYAGGDVASQLAVESLFDSFEKGDFQGEPNDKRPRRGNELVWAIEAANGKIFDAARATEEYEGMGTTLIAARFSPKKQRVFIGHVGDSRAYRLRQGKLTQLTRDHTLGASGVSGPFASHLSRALGIKDHVKVDLVIDAPHPSDIFLLCSDGLPKMVKDEEVREILTKHADVESAVKLLIDKANAAGGRDNTTVIVIRVSPPGEMVQISRDKMSSNPEVKA